MDNKAEEREKAAKLRWRAEEIAEGKGLPFADHLEVLSPQMLRRSPHELRVHQIELELQNEELRRTLAELEALRARYFDLYNQAPVGYCIVAMDGLILEANLTAVTLLSSARATLVKQPITRFIMKEDQDIYYLHRKHLFETGEPNACELRMVKKDGSPFWVRLTATTALDPTTRSAKHPEGVRVSRLVLSDISERKAAEEAQALLETKLQEARRRVATGFKSGRGLVG